jgi:hypothetical protein
VNANHYTYFAIVKCRHLGTLSTLMESAAGGVRPLEDNALKLRPLWLRGPSSDITALNRNEEKEHAAMILEWIRRKDPTFDKELKDYLFTEKPIAHD